MVKGEGFVTQKRMDEKTIAFFLACQGYYAKHFKHTSSSTIYLAFRKLDKKGNVTHINSIVRCRSIR